MTAIAGRPQAGCLNSILSFTKAIFMASHVFQTPSFKSRKGFLSSFARSFEQSPVDTTYEATSFALSAFLLSIRNKQFLSNFVQIYTEFWSKNRNLFYKAVQVRKK